MIWIEWTATAFGFLAVALLMKQSVWNWPAGLIQVSLYIVVFWHAKLYSDLVLHVIYVVLQIYGWYHWLHGEAGHELRATTLAGRAAAGWSLTALCAAALWGTLMLRITDAAAPYADAFTMMTSLVAQWLTTRKKIESWLFWIAVDIVAIALFWYKRLYPTAGLYVAFLLMSAGGYFSWRREMLRERVLDEGRLDAGEVRAAAPRPSAGP